MFRISCRSSFLLLCSLVVAVLSDQTPVFAADQESYIYKGIGGIVLHDRGPLSDAHEHGVDVNAEVQFQSPDWRIWRIIGSPYPTLGITPNFNGETSAAYAGLTYEIDLRNDTVARYLAGVNQNMFLGLGIGAAAHNGPLHKDPVACRDDSDCGFGHRVIAHLSIELGYKLSAKNGIGIFVDHMSHRYVLPGENEGVDHIGVRYYFHPW